MDLVGEELCVSCHKMKVWVDASSLATEMALEVNKDIVEDACWLHMADAKYVNLAEINAMIKDINLALQ